MKTSLLALLILLVLINVGILFAMAWRGKTAQVSDVTFGEPQS